MDIPEVAAKVEPYFKAMSESTHDPAGLYEIKNYIIKSNFLKVSVRVSSLIPEPMPMSLRPKPKVKAKWPPH